jgi:hypothetical protein
MYIIYETILRKIRNYQSVPLTGIYRYAYACLCLKERERERKRKREILDYTVDALKSTKILLCQEFAKIGALAAWRSGRLTNLANVFT